MAKASDKKIIKGLVGQARKQGWKVDEKESRHIKFFVPNGPIVVVPRTPSDHRSLPNSISRLRREGLQWPR